MATFGKKCRQVAHDLRIVRAAAGYDELFAAGGEALDSDRDRGCGQDRRCRDQIGQRVLEFSIRWTNSAPYCSRPADLGGFSL